MSVPLEFDFCRIFLRYFSLLTVESHPGESSNTRSCFMLSKTGSAMAGWVTWFEYKFTCLYSQQNISDNSNSNSILNICFWKWFPNFCGNFC